MNAGFWVRDHVGDYVNLAVARRLTIEFHHGTKLLHVVAVWQDGSSSITAIAHEDEVYARAMCDRIAQAMSGDVANRMAQRFLEEYGNGQTPGT